MLLVQGVTKIFEKEGRKIKALNRVSFSLEKPCVLGIIGLNGAGKTTLLNVISGILLPDEGFVKINGHSPEDKPRKLVAYPFLPYRDPRMKVHEVIDYLEAFHDKKVPERYLETLELYPEWETQVQKLSTGYIRRLEILSAIIQDKDVVVLDEVTNGVDVKAADIILNFIKSISKKHFVLFATHIFNHAEKICDKYLVLHKGIVRYFGSADDFCSGKSLEKRFKEVIS